MFTKEEKLLYIIDKSLRDAKVSKKQLAEKMEMKPSALSQQFARLKEGGNIPIKTIFAVQELTGVKIFNF